ncbi:MAG TPA: phosphopantetheine-binding protein [Pseudonocardiaceae bacterium]|jgi:acyl carrier protein|nr:phosphopantetheine-binding protein [Pseudonocardiaceae bacterium]
MNRPDLIKAIAVSLAEVMQREYGELTEETRLFEDLHLDSTSILTLLMALEDEVGIDVDPESLDMDTFRTVGTLADYLEAKQEVA